MKTVPILPALASTLAPLFAFAAPSADISEAPAVLPRPVSLTVSGKTGFSLAGPVAINFDKDFTDAAQVLQSGLRIQGVTTLSGAGSPEPIVFKKVEGLAKEAYRIAVTPTGVTVEASDAAGAFYGAQTLVQAVVKDAAGKPALPAMSVTDAPRFGWRGLMIDSSRHFVKFEDMKRIVDLMALYKLNTLHWHLTDDQGWRIEIKAYPKLTEIGARRDESPVPGARNKGDGKPYGPFFYTQDQVKELVAYAKARSITIIPEIELPGHAQAAIASYPELGNNDAPGFGTKTHTRWGVNHNVFAPKEATFKFLDTVIGEVAALFPDSPYIHVGGDECPKDQWNRSPFAQELMKKEGIVGNDGKPDSHKLQAWIIARVEKMINKRGKKLIGWDEIQEGGLSPTATMMVWRNWGFAKHAIERGNDVVMTPTSHCYLDYGQGPAPKSPEFEAIGGNLPVDKVLSVEPIPGGLKAGEEKHVLGVQGNLWSEYIFNRPKWDYMAFPRAIAIAEVGWSPKEGKNFKDFSARLDKNQKLLDALGVNYRKSDGSPARSGDKIVNE